MPFTLAHPAVVVPLAHRFPRHLVLSALVVGSMSPDFEYFVSLRPVRTISHDLIGIPLLCVPSGLMLLWLFEHVVKRPMALLLPRALRVRLLPYCDPIAFLPAGRLLAIVGSLAIGAFTHIAWDSLTHENGWVVERWSLLSATLVPGLRVFKALQHGSTLIGLALLAAWSSKWILAQGAGEDPPGPLMPDRLRLGVVSALMLVACIAGVATALRAGPIGIYALIVRAVIASLSSSCVAALTYGAAYRTYELRTRPAHRPGEATRTPI